MLSEGLNCQRKHVNRGELGEQKIKSLENLSSHLHSYFSQSTSEEGEEEEKLSRDRKPQNKDRAMTETKEISDDRATSSTTVCQSQTEDWSC